MQNSSHARKAAHQNAVHARHIWILDVSAETEKPAGMGITCCVPPCTYHAWHGAPSMSEVQSLLRHAEHSNGLQTNPNTQTRTAASTG